MEEEITLSAAATNRLLHFEDCQTAIDQLYAEALQADGGNGFDEFMRFANCFSNLSVYNAMLVRVQRPGAAAVATRAKWMEIGRPIKPDAIPIVILRSFGPVSFVYDQEDTVGSPLLAEEDNSLLATGELSEKTYKQTCLAADRYLIDVEETDRYGPLLAGTAAGYEALPDRITIVDAQNKKPSKFKIRRGYRIRLNSRHDLATRFATLSHELGHIYCGHLGSNGKGQWQDRSNIEHAVRELEAEAVSWLVCSRNGVKTKSREYLSTLMKKADLSKVSMYAIYEAANRVESRTMPTSA